MKRGASERWRSEKPRFLDEEKEEKWEEDGGILTGENQAR